MRDFDAWFATFRNSIATYDYYVDFQKVTENANRYRAELHLLNALVGQRDIEHQFCALLKQYPSVLPVIPLLLAVRKHELYAADAEGGGRICFTPQQTAPETYCTFMRKTGLFDLIENRVVSNLYDYVLGVEVGLDSNGRKGRGGKLMANLVETYLEKAKVPYAKEVNASDIKTRWACDLGALINDGKAEKRFDFVVKTPRQLYGIEVNFYQSNGSKLNETARSYKMLALEAHRLEGFTFVWFTDGGGWKSARENLRETFDVLPTLHNIHDLEQGVAEKLFR